MNSKTGLHVSALCLFVGLAGALLGSTATYAETAGMERRDNRRDDRQGAQDIRQEGRDVARDVKDECRDANGSGPECRQAKRKTNQNARQKARDLKIND